MILQEELAFVFEMLQQFEDALVQYDELDALFTQYVLNFGAGGKLLPPRPHLDFSLATSKANNAFCRQD